MPVDSILSGIHFSFAAELRLFWLIAAIYAFPFILHLFHVITRGEAPERRQTRSCGQGASSMLV
jgi:hypothetical protein